MVVDEMDLQRTLTRMEMAGWGEEWFWVWLSNFVVDVFTAHHVEVARESGGMPPNMAPSRTISASTPPPPPRLSAARIARENGPSNAASSAPLAPSSSTTGLRCYTLEAYSETFLQPPHQKTRQHLFSCGTRVRDLRTEDHPDVLAACNARTIFSQATTADSNTQSHFPTLRVVLTPSEEKRHGDLQPVNTVTQRIPLLRVNDDYCDCLDGTDELLTNACSMSGPLSPAAGSRWKSYLVSNQAIRLYDEMDQLEQEDSESRGFQPTPRKRGDVGDRLHVSQGPVLPFVCLCGDGGGGRTVRQLLAPSLVGDGVVDCCNAEDEAMLQAYPFAPLPHFSNNPQPAQEECDRVLAREQARVMVDWKQRRAHVSAQLNAAVSYVDAVFPYHTSARALLVDKGYYSLFSPDVVLQERVAAATTLRDLYSRGHQTQRRRVQKGWERLGQGLTENRTQMQVELANITRELQDLERFVHNRMAEQRTNNPIEAGVPMELLRRHDQLAGIHQGLRMELQHLTMTSIHHAYGDHYEYYPLVRNILGIASAKVTDASTPPHLYSGIAQERAKRFVQPSQMEQLVAAAQQQGLMTPPFHTDNLSISHYGIEVMRHTMAAQNFDRAEAPYVAQRLGLRRRDSTAPFDPHILDSITDPFLRAPVLPLGSWQPHQSGRDGRVMQLADPAGGLHLERRACVAARSPLYRGGGRLQLATRRPEPPRRVTVSDGEDEKKSFKDKLKAAADGTQAAVRRIDIPYHFHMPFTFAVDTYVGQLRCDPDPLSPAESHRRNPTDDGGAGVHDAQTPPRTVQTYTTFLCDTKDRVLYWGRNGKCTQEVIIGTPSACTAWSLKAAKDALEELTPRPSSKKRDKAESAEA
jgi:hypothetical protein